MQIKNKLPCVDIGEGREKLIVAWSQEIRDCHIVEPIPNKIYYASKYYKSKVQNMKCQDSYYFSVYLSFNAEK